MATEVLQPSLSYLEQREFLRSRPERRRDLRTSLWLIGVVILAHAAAIGDGVFMQDHWYRVVLRHAGWSLRSLELTADLELPGHIAHLWWQEKPLHFIQARPAAFLVMKAEYVFSGGRPWAIHIFGLCWHALACILVFHLARWLMLDRHWCLLAGAVFAFSPHSVVAVSWFSARGELVGACAFMGAVLAYTRASAVEQVRRSRRSQRLYQIGWQPVSLPWLGLVLALWFVAMLCCEAAIVLPLVLMVVDVGYGRRGLLMYRLPIHLVMISLAAAFGYWRFVVYPAGMVTGHPLVQYPDGVGLLPWLAGRWLQLTVSLLLGHPLLSEILHLDPLGRNRTMTLLLTVLVFLPVAGWYEYASRPLRCRLLWPLWAALTLAAVIPSFVLPQAGYLPFAGCAVMAAVLLARLGSRPLRILGILLAVGILLPFAAHRIVWRGVIRSEQLLYAGLRDQHPPPMPSSKVFFINLPLTGLFAPVAMRDLWSMRDLCSPPDLDGYVLTFANNPLEMTGLSVVEQTGDNELVVATEPPGYFSGIVGQVLRTLTRGPRPLPPGTVISGDTFDTTILEADDQGVRRLRFTFVQPLASRHFHFYVSTPKHPLRRWRPAGPAASPARVAPSHAALFEAARSADDAVRPRARVELVHLAWPVALETASPLQETLAADPRLERDESVDRLEKWWKEVDASRLVEERQRWRANYAPLLRDRDRALRFIRRLRTILPIESLSPPAVPEHEEIPPLPEPAAPAEPGEPR